MSGSEGIATVDVSRPFRGRVFRYGDHVNTDVIFPGRYTYTKSRPEEVAPHALEDLDPILRLKHQYIPGYPYSIF